MTSSKQSDKIKERLLEYSGLMVLRYGAIEFDIDPFHSGFFHISCNGMEWDAYSIDEVMSIPFVDGKCLADIASHVEVIDW